MGVPSHTERQSIHFRTGRILRERLQAAADAEGVTLSEYCRIVLEEAIAKKAST